MKRPNRLTTRFVQEVAEPGRYGDGRGSHGLSLLVKPAGVNAISKTWARRFKDDNGKITSCGLGAFPIVSLAQARRAAATLAVKAAQEGEMVFRAMPAALVAAEPATGPTFAEVAEDAITLRKAGWRGAKTEGLWRHTIELAAPLAKMQIASITSVHILDVLASVWHRPELARKVKQHIGAVMRYAISRGLRADDPTSAAVVGLPRTGKTTEHHESLDWRAIPSFLEFVEDSQSYEAKKHCLTFLVLTAARGGEARGATWGEIDLASKTWTVPGSRMKAGRTHKIPLSAQAIDVLRAAQAIQTDHSANALIFPNKRGDMIGDDALRGLVRRNFDSTVHGMRSTFAGWCQEQAGAPNELIQACLAHAVGDATAQAYLRSDLFERRRELLAAWGSFCIP